MISQLVDSGPIAIGIWLFGIIIFSLILKKAFESESFTNYLLENYNVELSIMTKYILILILAIFLTFLIQILYKLYLIKMGSNQFLNDT